MKKFQSPLGGEEIMSICGLKEGREIGQIKKSIEEAILDGMKCAHEVSTSTMKERMEDLTGGFKLNLPGMGDEN